MAEKTEKATPKKLRDARKKGQVAKSQDFPSAFTFIVSIAATLLSTGFLFQQLGGYIVSIFKRTGGTIDLENRAGGFISEALMVIFTCSLPIMVITTVSGILVSFLIVGPLFSVEAFKFDIKKLNPVTNIRNLFKFKTIFELLKAVFKISGALFLIYTVIRTSLPEVISTAGMPVMGSALVFSSFLLKVVIRVGLFFLIVAIFDLIFQKRNFAKEMRMEKFEVKQEFKDTEGDPHIKSRRRQTAQEIAYQEGPSAVKRAKAVITNPEHIAVAVDYEPEKEPAPRIVTMGKGPVADMIIKAAQEYNVPIMRNVTLAQILFAKGRISEYIPEETYQAVAEILKWLAGLEAPEVTAELFK
ncbi:MAG TPA: type III secretion system export apparatus subunit SctU [Rhabdochlamydiaceae bacterium]|nr:type III secretion system export apparatus subunit SctU [Rhabdochlamydiaceae bacterium]